MNRHAWAAQTSATLLALLFLSPLVLQVVSSFKTRAELREGNQHFFPSRVSWENYREVASRTEFRQQFRNSLILCFGTVTGTLISSSLAAYGFARVRWRARKWLFGLLVATMLLPWQVTMIPRFLLLRQLGLYDSLAALILPAFLGDAFAIFLLTQFMRSLPEELSEAGRLDGLSEFGIYWHIVLPLCRPALLTVALFQFTTTWNDLGGPMLYLSSPEKFPLSYGLEQFTSSYADQTHLLLAATVLFGLPIVVLVVVMQRFFQSGFTAKPLM